MKTLIVASITSVLIFTSMTSIASAERRLFTATDAHIQDANNSFNVQQRKFCNEEPGNPYDERTDYQAWSAWRADGSYDGRNDCH
jgi:hypothetical protein